MKKKDDFMWEITNGIQISLISYLIGGMFISYIHLLIFWIIIPLAIVLKNIASQNFNEKSLGKI